MKLMHHVTALACLAMPLVQPAPARSETPAAASVSVREDRVDDPGHPSIPVVIWAPVSGSGFAMVVLSHGTGAGPLSHVDTAQSLAAAGFVVVAPMHPGDNFQDDSAVGKPSWFADRSRHVSKVIDFMLTRWEGHERLSPRRIGIFGFSAGATTGLVSIGGVPDLARIAPHCAKTPEFVCKIMGPQTGEAPDWKHDSRIAAAVIAAPGIGFAFEPAGLKKAHVPVQLWSGSADDTVPYASNAGIVRRLMPNADFHSVDNAVHLSFLAPCTRDSPAFLCNDAPGFDRAVFHSSFNKAVVAFFIKHLPG